MKQIREWLENGGQPYAQGVALYAAHGSSRVVLSALQYGETEFTRQKLRTELSRLVEGAPAPKTAPTPSAVATPAVPADETLRQQRSSWYAERHRLHAQLELLPTDEARRVAAGRILLLSELLTASYQPGAAAAPAPRPDLSGLSDQGEIRRLLGNLRPQRTRLKQNPARALDLQQVEADIKLLETKLRKS